MRRGILLVLSLAGLTLLVTMYYVTAFPHAFLTLSDGGDFRSKTPPLLYACKAPGNVSDKFGSHGV